MLLIYFKIWENADEYFMSILWKFNSQKDYNIHSLRFQAWIKSVWKTFKIIETILVPKPTHIWTFHILM